MRGVDLPVEIDAKCKYISKLKKNCSQQVDFSFVIALGTRSHVRFAVCLEFYCLVFGSRTIYQYIMRLSGA